MRRAKRPTTAPRETIPWNEEGFLAAFARWQALLELPPAEQRPGAMSAYFVERYGRGRGLLHFTRWLRIGDFLARHISRLQVEGLLWAGPGGSLEMRRELISSLCRTPLRRNRLTLADVLDGVRRARPRRRSPYRKVDRK
jgi:hypothetical protein